MNQEMREKFLKGQIDMSLVNRLLNSELSSYRIGTDSGVDRSVVNRVRKGDRSVERLETFTAYRLSEYAKRVFKYQPEDQ